MPGKGSDAIFREGGGDNNPELGLSVTKGWMIYTLSCGFQVYLLEQSRPFHASPKLLHLPQRFAQDNLKRIRSCYTRRGNRVREREGALLDQKCPRLIWHALNAQGSA